MFSPRITISPISPSPTSMIVRVAQAELDAADRRAHRSRLGRPVRMVERGDRGGLGEAVALQQREPEGLLDPAEHLHRQRRAAGRGRSAGRWCRSAPGPCTASRAMYMVGTPRKTVTRSLRDDPQRLLAVELRQQRQAGAAGHRRSSGRQVWPNEWNSGSPPKTTSPGAIGISVSIVVRTLLPRLAWRELGALGLTGGAGGVQDDRGVVGRAIGDHVRGRLESRPVCRSNSPRHGDDHVGAGHARPPWCASSANSGKTTAT